MLGRREVGEEKAKGFWSPSMEIHPFEFDVTKSGPVRDEGRRGEGGVDVLVPYPALRIRVGEKLEDGKAKASDNSAEEGFEKSVPWVG